MMMMPSPWESYWGRPARPNICMTSNGDSSPQAPFSGLYTWVPLMMTVCAGRFTPHASVAVETSTCKQLTRYQLYTLRKFLLLTSGQRHLLQRALTLMPARDSEASEPTGHCKNS